MGDENDNGLLEPLSPIDAKQLIRQILRDGEVGFRPRHGAERSHAEDQMDDPLGLITMVDVKNVLRGGVVRPGELERGTWRYQVRTARFTVVIAFTSAASLVVVTTWRNPT